MILIRTRSIRPIASLLFAIGSMATIQTLHAKEGSQNMTEKLVTSDQLRVIAVKKINSTTVEITFSNQQKMLVDFYGPTIFRLFQDNSGAGLRAPKAEPEAQILVDNPRKNVSTVSVTEQPNEWSISTEKISVVFNKETALFKILNA